MGNIDEDTGKLNQLGAEMFNLSRMQLVDAINAFLTLDKDLAEKVIQMEYKVNALNLKIDHECEQFLTLNKPGSDSLRTVLALQKINFDLELMGDYALGIASYTLEQNIITDKRLLKNLRLEEMFSCIISMLEDICEAFALKESQRAHKVFKKEKLLNEINNISVSVISDLVKKEVELTEQILLLFSVIKKVETVGDLATKIAQHIIFYREAERLKPNKAKFYV